MHRAFTLIELLVVIAIIAILASILFPVFASAKAAAKKASCISRIGQFSTAHHLYLTDSDDRLAPAAYGDFENMHTAMVFIGNLLQPYMRNYDILASPGDPAPMSARLTMDVPNPDLFPEPQRTRVRQSILAHKSNYGYNVQNLSPVFGFRREGTIMGDSSPISAGSIGSPAQTLTAVTSLWEFCGQQPCGGGTFMVDAPCRHSPTGQDTFQTLPPGAIGRWIIGPGWWPSEPYNYWWFGNVWAFHGSMATVLWADGHVSTRTLSGLATGCDVRDGWTGRIFDREAYIWDLE
jgi:prepilin-type N-terminal cleavage/methylation domain-containing protein/prepilin-type processing-associated H-X9-DG protein